MQGISYLAVLQKSEPANQHEGDSGNEEFTEEKGVFALEQRLGLGESREGWENSNVGAELVSLCKTFRIGTQA